MKSVMIAAMLMTGVSTAAFAGGDWVFSVTNKSDVAVTRFRTQENGEWSGNWIKKTIEPGDTFEMHFGHSDGDCEVRTKVEFEDDTFFDTDVDYCHADKITVYNKRMTWK